jgi:hypothetical protein
VKHTLHLSLALVVLGILMPALTLAQSDESVPLGDLARALRRTNPPAAPVTIDNDNLSQVMDQVENRRLKGGPLFSMDGSGKGFQMSSADGTCSLSFSANSTALLSTPYVAEDLPQNELSKLEGPASIAGDTLQVSVYNGSSWDLKEITVGLTLVRRENASAHLANANFLSVAATDAPASRPSDLTLLLHIKGTAAPLMTTVFSQKLGTTLAPDQEWHWAIVQARGIPPNPLAAPQN